MERSLAQDNYRDPSANKQALNERIKLIRKLRWIGMEEQANELQSIMVRDHIRAVDSVVAECGETD
jgi:hypothetical protein